MKYKPKYCILRIVCEGNFDGDDPCYANGKNSNTIFDTEFFFFEYYQDKRKIFVDIDKDFRNSKFLLIYCNESQKDILKDKYKVTIDKLGIKNLEFSTTVINDISEINKTRKALENYSSDIIDIQENNSIIESEECIYCKLKII